MKLPFGGALRRWWPGGLRQQSSSQLATSSAVDCDVRALRAMLESVEDGLLACDGSQRLVLVNPAAADLLEMDPVGQPMEEWPGATLMLRPVLERAMAHGHGSIEFRSDQGERELVLEGRARAMAGESGQADGAVMVLRDVTRSRELAVARTDDWAALAHDLKTPLNSISGFTTLLLQEAVGPLNPLQRDFLRTIEQEGHRLLQAVQGFLEEAKAGGPNGHVNLIDLHLPTLVEEIVDRVRILTVRKMLSIEVDVPSNLPLVSADREKIGLVLMNLLDNAISFSREGTHIGVSAIDAGDCIELSIKDDGIGIPEDSLSLIFGPYFRAQNQPQAGRPGVGLGLAICKQLVERHGGRIWAESPGQGGARLTFTLPVAFRQARLEMLSAPL